MGIIWDMVTHMVITITVIDIIEDTVILIIPEDIILKKVDITNLMYYRNNNFLFRTGWYIWYILYYKNLYQENG